jgi:mono/diheme cytochrome c family protein
MNRLGGAFVWLAAFIIVPSAAISQDVTAPAQSLAERGKYLTDAGNCLSCHTRAGAVPFAGGLAFDTPFGTIYSSNITPDPATGIGKWTALDLRRAMHQGIDNDGDRLFPAFPYTSFTKVTNEDVDAIYAYLRTLKPVRYTSPSNGLLFAMRWPLALWNSLFFNEGRYAPNSTQSAEWNRGAYLVEGLGHCSACHTPRNLFMAEDSTKSYAGGIIQDEVAKGKQRRWSAVNLSSAKNGLGSWSVNDLAKYLQTGFSARAGSFGPMNAVILNSLKNLKSEDVHAMAVYLKSLPARDYTGAPVSTEQIKAGESIYKDRCEKCHSSSGRGGMLAGPPVAGSAVVQADDPASLINVILYGPDVSEGIPTGAWETMESYGDVLDDAQIAAVSNFLRGSWGNRGAAVTESEVALQR